MTLGSKYIRRLPTTAGPVSSLKFSVGVSFCEMLRNSLLHSSDISAIVVFRSIAERRVVVFHISKVTSVYSLQHHGRFPAIAFWI